MRYEPVLELRGKLEQLGRLRGLVQEEKGQQPVPSLRMGVCEWPLLLQILRSS